tara:strand:- start:35097 stop:35363 length:267 start_codon:yes stop_codon:yes gene_type:complete
MQVGKRGLYIGVPQQVLDTDDVQTHFQQMGRIAVPQAMGGDLFLYTAVFPGLPNDPLHPRRGQCNGIALAVIAVKAPGNGPFRRDVFP